MRYREILEACWKGYHKEGMKTMFGKRYPNCVKNTNEELEEDLRKWFKEKWVRFGPDGKIRGDCARGDDSEGKPKCLPQSKAQNLGKKGRASAASRKRREDPNPERSGKAINVNTKKKSNEGVAEEINPDILDRRFAHKQQIGDYLYTAKGGNNRLEILAFDKKRNKVGHALFVIRGKYLESMDTEVSGEHRDQGIARAMYTYAKMLGNDIKASPFLLPGGEKMWKAWKKSGDAKHLSSVAEEQLDEKWSTKYKDSINCANPKGFSQRAHCAGKKKNESVTEATGYIPVNDKEARDPRYSMAITQDIKPGEVQRQAAKMGFKTDAAGIPPKLNSSGKI
jgi:predicted GNAT family acetyltransferase